MQSVDNTEPQGNKQPHKTRVEVTVYERNPDVVAWVLRHAEGVCELCGADAPFMRSNGTPYLEVHHVDPLGEDGPDTIENAVALCPNCHKAVHYAQDRHQLTLQIRDQVERIQGLG